MENLFTVSPAPHLKEKESVKKLMWGVIFSLLPAGFFTFYFFRFYALKVISVSVGTCVLTEVIFLRLRKGVFPSEPSALLTGILLAFVLPPSFPWWGVVMGGVFSILVGKQIFGGLGYNIFNPALLGRAFLMATFPVLMTSYLEPHTLNALTGATPLGLWKFQHKLTPLFPLALGEVPGSLGETSSFALFGGAVFLLLKRYIDWRIPLSYLGSFLLLTTLFSSLSPKFAPPLFHLFSGGLILGAFFMATDPVTSPVTPLGRWIFGLGGGTMVGLIRLFGGYPEGVMFSILFMNALTPLINRGTKPRVLGERR